MNWMSIIGLCLIVLGTVFSFFGTYSANKKSQSELSSKIQEKNITIENINQNNIKLIDQNTSLLSSNDEVSTTNKDLIGQNNEMLNKIAKYQSDIETRNLKIQELEKEVSNVKQYSYYADYSIYGSNFNTKGTGGIKINSDLIERMSPLLTEQKDGMTYVIVKKENLPLVNEVIKKYPNFPFGYYVKFELLKAYNDDEWIDVAKKAIEIFDVTTTIQSHHISHDEVLSILKKAINSVS